MWNKHYENGRLTLDIELTTHCNARCPQCSRTDELNKVSKKSWLPLTQVSINQFKNWFSPEDLNHIKNLHFSGTYGDPGMCKDLIEIVKYIIDESSTTTISINTNGGMRDEMFWWQIGAIGRERLTLIFDVDGSTPEMHAFYRRGVDLNKVLQHIEAVAETPANLRVLTVVFKHNEDYLEQIQDMCREIGVEHFDYVEGNNFQAGSEYLFIDEDGNEQKLEQVTRKDREQGLKRLERRVRDHRHKYIVDEYKKIECLAAEKANLKIHATGLVAPCCYLSTPLETKSIYKPDQPASYHITTTGKEGDEINPLMKEYVDRYQDFSLNNRSIKDIVHDSWFKRQLIDSWKQRQTATFGCVKVCGKT